MSTDRGAGSVTLDTIIAIAQTALDNPGMERGALQRIVQTPLVVELRSALELCEQICARHYPTEIVGDCAHGCGSWPCLDFNDSRNAANDILYSLGPESLRGEPQTPTHQPPRGADCR